MNRLGDEKIMVLWWFFVVVLVSVSIIGAVIMFYGANVDVRELEAKILSEKMVNCFSNLGYIDSEALKEFDIYSKCNLNRVVFDEGSEFYIRISLFDEKNNLIGTQKHFGQRSYEKDCSILENTRGEKLPKCNLEKIKLLDSENKNIYLEVLTASNQKGRAISKQNG